MALSDLEDAVHVWYCRPDEIIDQAKLDSCRSLLSANEADRLQRFHYKKDQHSYLVSHALVRKALSEYCDIAPQQWLFTMNAHGKPEISTELDCPPLKFNLSHTDGLSVCIVSLNNDCGIDVENSLRHNKLMSIAQRMFAQPELETMRDLTEDEMRDTFFDYWTLREAYVKALGAGLQGSSKQFYFELAKRAGVERIAEICFVDENEYRANKWQFSLHKPTVEHTFAVAVHLIEGERKKIICQPLLL